MGKCNVIVKESRKVSKVRVAITFAILCKVQNYMAHILNPLLSIKVPLKVAYKPSDWLQATFRSTWGPCLFEASRTIIYIL